MRRCVQTKECTYKQATFCPFEGWVMGELVNYVIFLKPGKMTNMKLRRFSLQKKNRSYSHVKKDTVSPNLTQLEFAFDFFSRSWGVNQCMCCESG